MGNWWTVLLGKCGIKVASATSEEKVVDNNQPVCCNDIVHIAYRGVSDDRMYLAYDRKWAEVKFFRPNGLRVFCADCRRRLL